MQELRTDAIDNLMGSLLVAGTYCLPEVMIYFDHQLLRGNRTTKVSTEHMAAFQSHNYPKLGHMGTYIHIQWDAIL